MKRLMRNVFLLAILLLVASVSLVAQNDSIPEQVPPLLNDPENLTIENLTLWREALYGLILLVLGYIHNYIPVANLFGKKYWRIVAAGLVLAVVFITTGFSQNVLGLAVSFLLTTLTYAQGISRELHSAPVRKAKHPILLGLTGPKPAEAA